ncbi:hypothetical protein L873DRAFT_1797060 [Choiromyces venosus 120613-1]|uniref:Uncharacterized protein n=1 Tax=Choiromyces venosus 120613-1 TaxID=1336337 RepID=A0A3N4K6F2_9PEZI|nr:hypothetical protein L873DRAFT_1797060 [Choiromyces venosus 120613-1]
MSCAVSVVGGNPATRRGAKQRIQLSSYCIVYQPPAFNNHVALKMRGGTPIPCICIKRSLAATAPWFVGNQSA